MTFTKERKQAAEVCAKAFDTEFFKVLCEPVRIDIIQRLILLGRSDVATIAEGLPQDRSVISRHLSAMERANITTSEKEGRHMCYDLDGPAIVNRIKELYLAAEKLTAICCPPDND